MTNKVLRKIVRIDEARCDGCGICVSACAEGALQIFDGKARLVSESYCDGLGACLPECPQGAITIVEREAENFDEAADPGKPGAEADTGALPCGCPSARVISRKPDAGEVPCSGPRQRSMLSHWPVQLALIPPSAPFLRGADIVLTADCVPFACAEFHGDYLRGHAAIVACPKLDDYQAHLKRLTAIIRSAGPKSLTVLRMEVPCCSGLTHMAAEAVRSNGQDLKISEVIIPIP